MTSMPSASRDMSPDVPHRAPPTVDALAATVHELRDAGQPMRFVGSGTWLQGGGPFADATPISLRALAGVVDYTPGDLVITVRAGMTLRELSAITAEHGQMFATAPYGGPHGSPDSTIGAIIATSASAPLSLDDLAVRDLVLGLTVVTGTGAVTRAGGRVVKNVAGFDLVRLHTGAWGTLGAIAEVSLRLHAIPAHDILLEGTLTPELGDALPPLIANRAPIPMQVMLTPGATPRFIARVTGNAARVNGLRTQLRQLGVRDIVDVPPDTLSTLRETPADAVVLRLRTALSDAVPFVRAARQAFPEATLSYAPQRGTLRVVMPGEAPSDALSDALSTLSRLATSFGASHRIAIAIDQGRTQYPARTPLEAGIKAALDPDDLCNRVATMAPAPAPLPV